MSGLVIMVQGTASSVGKSLVCAGLCRLLARRGLRVAPFKAQNMALNSYVTPDGAEIGRAQAVQADAAGVVPTADMNPILLKPEAEARAQVVVHGRPIGAMGAAQYHEHKPRLRAIVSESLARLRASHDVVVIEGAGSPVEVNLKQNDIVNMDVAVRAGAPVLLVADIDRGGVFASLVGTMVLLPPEEQALVAGLVINKFRGDPRLLGDGLAFLHQRTGVPVLGVLPFLKDLRIPDEDSLALDERPQRTGALRIAVVRLPRISNFDDVEALEHSPDTAVTFAETPAQLADADLVILPGTKSTIADLTWLRERGLADALLARAARAEPILGICGGYQMLGVNILDPEHLESTTAATEGLALLPITTRFHPTKVTARVRARTLTSTFLTPTALDLDAYEIHMGHVTPLTDAPPLFHISERNAAPIDLTDGTTSPSGAILGTLLHGLLENAPLRHHLLTTLRTRRNLPPVPHHLTPHATHYDRLADSLQTHLDLPHLERIIGLPPNTLTP